MLVSEITGKIEFWVCKSIQILRALKLSTRLQ